LDEGKEIWLLRMPENLQLSQLDGMKLSVRGGDGVVVGRVVGGAAKATGNVTTSTFGGDLVIFEEDAARQAWRPMVKTKAGGLRAAPAPAVRVLAAAVEHDLSQTEMSVAKFAPPICFGEESVFSEHPLGEEYLGPDFAAETKYVCPLHSRAPYNGKKQWPNMKVRFFPNSTREPRGVKAVKPPAPATIKEEAAAATPAAAGDSEKKKKKKKKRDRSAGAAAASPAAPEPEKKKKKKSAKKKKGE